MEKKSGLVAFFDILGYQNFLEHNEPEVAALKISEFLKNLRNLQSEKFPNIFYEARYKDIAKRVVENIKCLVISDAILLTLEMEKENQDTYRNKRGVFLLYCAKLFKDLFVYGLPTRGAIEYGEYVLIENQMFAGRPIVKAYQSAMDMDLSACQMSDSVGTLPKGAENSIYVKYDTPLRSGDEKKLLLLMPVDFGDEEDGFILRAIPDLKQFVVNSFAAHNKMVNKSIQSKIVNTELFLRYCLSRLKIEAPE